MNITEKTFQTALKLLNAVKANYRIVLPDGTVVDTLPPEPEKHKKRNLPNAYGTLTRQIKPHIESMVVGDVREIPAGDIEVTRMAKCASAVCLKTWGVGSAMVMSNKKQNVVEVLRVA